MEEQILDEVVARRFLLGQLSPEEQGRIEELAFDDPQSFAFLQAAEEDLIDEFVYDDLSPDERERFQKYFLAKSGRREDLRIASALRQHFDQKIPARSFWQWLRKWLPIGPTPLIPVMVKAAVIITAIIGLVILILVFRPRSNPPVQVKQEHPSTLPSPTTTASETPAPASPSPSHKDDQNKPTPTPHRSTSPFYILLAPGGPVRTGGGDTPVSKKSGAPGFELPLIGNGSYRTYTAALDNDGKPIQTWTLKPTRIKSGKGVRVSVPFDQLEVSQRYRFVLKGVDANGNLQPVHEYYFVVTN